MNICINKYHLIIRLFDITNTISLAYSIINQLSSNQVTHVFWTNTISIIHNIFSTQM